MMDVLSKPKLRQYQIDLIEGILYHLTDNDRCCASLATGGGKTFIFTNLIERLGGKVLVLMHRIELINQTSSSLDILDIKHDKIIAGNKHGDSDVYICMVQTLYNLIKKGKIDINIFDTIIVDECHRGDFFKIIDGFNGKVIGFTATPCINISEIFFLCENCLRDFSVNTNCCGKESKKYKKTRSLSDYYGKLIQGVGIAELIKDNYLVPEINYCIENKDLGILELDSFNEFSDYSQALVFGSESAIKNFCDVFEEMVFGKKTIVFNCNTLVNKDIYDQFVKKDYPVKMYDSLTHEEKREDIIKWFKETDGAILLNVQVFTTGFDVREVECIVLNKATNSLNLFIQMVGRGGRTTDKIYKPSFDLIDMGGNVDRHGKWSDGRNWDKLYYQTNVKPVGSKPPPVRQCHACEGIIAANALICPLCGEKKKYTGGVHGIPKINGKMPLPNVKNMIEYCRANGHDMLYCRKLVYDYFSKMFYDTPFDVFNKHKNSASLYVRIKHISRPMYFQIQESGLTGNMCRTIESFVNEIIKKIEKSYDGR